MKTWILVCNKSVAFGNNIWLEKKNGKKGYEGGSNNPPSFFVTKTLSVCI